MIQGVLVSDLTQSCEDGTLELELETLCRHNSHGDGGQCGYSTPRQNRNCFIQQRPEMGIVLVLGGIKLVDISIDIVDIFCLCAESCICSVGSN